MKEVSLHVGSRIRLYRKAKKLTLLALSQKIHKSKATLSKYETGDITIDIETLFDIAEVLGIKVQQLLDYNPPGKAVDLVRPAGSFFPQRRVYVYFYDGRVGKLIRNMLEVDNESARSNATFYNDIPSCDRYEECRNLNISIRSPTSPSRIRATASNMSPSVPSIPSTADPKFWVCCRVSPATPCCPSPSSASSPLSHWMKTTN